MEKNKLKQHLFSLLARREYSEWELRNKLTKLTENNALVDEIIYEFQANGWQSDQRFIESLITSKQYKHGTLKIKQDLKLKGVKDTEFVDLLPSHSQQIETALALLNKKYKTSENTASIKQKYFRFLLSKGFSNDIVYRLLMSSHHKNNG